MMRYRFLLVAGVGIVLTVMVITLAGRSQAGDEPVYSVAVVDRGLHQDPRAWLGRAVEVRGRAVPVAPNAPFFQLRDVRTAASWLVWAVQDNGLRASLRRLPLVRLLVPAPQQVHFGAPAVYRLHIADPQRSCVVAICAIFVLDDAALSRSQQRMLAVPPSNLTVAGPLSH